MSATTSIFINPQPSFSISGTTLLEIKVKTVFQPFKHKIRRSILGDVVNGVRINCVGDQYVLNTSYMMEQDIVSESYLPQSLPHQPVVA
jgi:hypothetical protein